MFFPLQKTFSQTTPWMSEMEIDVLRDSEITFNRPSRFYEVMGNDCFDDNPMLKEMLICAGNELRSKDDRFLVFNKISTIYTRLPQNDQILTILHPNSPYTYKTEYIYYIKNDLEQTLGPEAAQNWKEHVDFYPEGEAKDKFNADIALSYSLKLDPKDAYQGEYDNLWVLTLVSEHGFFLRMYCFYKDLPKRKLKRYKAKVETIFRF